MLGPHIKYRLVWVFPTQLTYSINAIYCRAFLFPFPSSSKETILSAKLSLRHHFMSSVVHSTADAMKPSISNGYHLGSVNSSLVNLYLTPSLPFPLSQLCHLLFSSVSRAISIHQSSTDLPSSYLQHTHTPTHACIYSDPMQVSMCVWLCCSCSFKNISLSTE